MGNKDEKTTRERILHAAIRLFAQKSYAATGLRDIVCEAGVSVAMVNYHFGSKQALLEEIIDEFSKQIYSVAQKQLTSSEVAQLKLRRYIRAMIKLFRNNHDKLRIMITELPLDAPGIVEFKAERMGRLVELATENFMPSFPTHVQERIRIEVVAPALIGMLTFHFIALPVAQKAFGAQFDDAFYEGYADEIADLFLYGLMSQPQSTDQDTKDDHK